MASSQPTAGRGRGRPRQNLANSVSTDLRTPVVPEPIQLNTSSPTDDSKPSIVPKATATGGRGRAALLKRRAQVPDPQMTLSVEFGDASWNLEDLTAAQFHTNERPSPPIELGTAGREISLFVNYFPIQDFPKEGLVYQYHFDVNNQKKTFIPRELRRALFETWLYRYRQKHAEVERDRIVFDNEKIVLTFEKPLPDIDEMGIEEEVEGPNRAKRFDGYQITVKRVGEPTDLKSLRSLDEIGQSPSENNVGADDLQSIQQVLSIVLHERCSMKAEFIYNRSFFSQPAIQGNPGNWDLGDGKALWRGFYSCLLLRKGAYQLLMNIDVSHGVFLKKQSFLDFLCEVMRHSPSGQWEYGRNAGAPRARLPDVVRYLDADQNAEYYAGEIEFLLKHCQYRRVRSQVAGKVIGYTVRDLGASASKQTFPWKGNSDRLITVQEYYKEQYGIELSYPALPTVVMQNKSFVPMEFLDVESVRTKKITDDQRALLCLKSSMDPKDHFGAVQDIRENPEQQNFEVDPFIKAWRLNVDVNMLRTSGRVVPGPRVVYDRTLRTSYQQGAASSAWDNTRSQFYGPTRFPSIWGIINLSAKLNKNSCHTFYQELHDVAAARGIDCPEPIIYEEYHAERYSVTQTIAALEEIMRANSDCTFFIVILPDNASIRDRIYGQVKKLCELEYGVGVVTQMVRSAVKPGQKLWTYSKLNNILLKINTKLNGINSVLQVPPQIEQFFSKGHRIMYVGIDLSHGAPGLSRGRSTVAVVASADDIPNRYFKEVYSQERPSGARNESWEYVIKLKEIMMSLIRQYYDKHQSQPPRSIVIYRDGISDSEFDTVFEKELTDIREACTELSPNYRPRLTYIVVNKRGRTRLITAQGRENVPAGTVVDSSDVIPSTTYNFFLKSHAGQKGTARPTHYHVLYDDNELKPDQVQLLTFALCFASARCTRSISIPAPVKYADLLAFRANFYIDINEPPSAPSDLSPPAIPSGQSVGIPIKTTSTRIVLSAKLDNDCPFFV